MYELLLESSLNQFQIKEKKKLSVLSKNIQDRDFVSLAVFLLLLLLWLYSKGHKRRYVKKLVKHYIKGYIF